MSLSPAGATNGKSSGFSVCSQGCKISYFWCKQISHHEEEALKPLLWALTFIYFHFFFFFFQTATRLSFPHCINTKKKKKRRNKYINHKIWVLTSVMGEESVLVSCHPFTLRCLIFFSYVSPHSSACCLFSFHVHSTCLLLHKTCGASFHSSLLSFAAGVCDFPVAARVRVGLSRW